MSDRSGLERIERAWELFGAWLCEHAPLSYGLLRPGAADAQIDEAEQAIGVRFPPELRVLYRIHDGVRGVDLEEFGEQPLTPRGDDDPWHRQANAVDFMPDVGIFGVGLALPAVAGRGAVDGQAGEVGHRLSALKQEPDEQGGAAVVGVHRPQHLALVSEG